MTSLDNLPFVKCQSRQRHKQRPKPPCLSFKQYFWANILGCMMEVNLVPTFIGHISIPKIALESKKC